MQTQLRNHVVELCSLEKLIAAEVEQARMTVSVCAGLVDGLAHEIEKWRMVLIAMRRVRAQTADDKLYARRFLSIDDISALSPGRLDAIVSPSVIETVGRRLSADLI